MLQCVIAQTEQWMAGLDRAGASFLRDFNKTGCKETTGIAGRGFHAAYQGHDPQQGFVNTIIYPESLLADPVNFFVFRAHEAVHALQMQSCAAAHAVITNPHSDIVLAPRAYLRLRELKEYDAYAKEAHLTWLLSQTQCDIDTSVLEETMAVPPSWYEILRKTDKSLTDTLYDIGEDTIMREIETGDGPYSIRLQDHYHQQALGQYARALAARTSRNLTFVTLSPLDMQSVGDNMGLNPFENGFPEEDFDASILQELRRVEHMAGLGRDAILPTLSEALADRAMTKEEFLEAGRVQRPFISVAPATKNLAYSRNPA